MLLLQADEGTKTLCCVFLRAIYVQSEVIYAQGNSNYVQGKKLTASARAFST